MYLVRIWTQEIFFLSLKINLSFGEKSPKICIYDKQKLQTVCLKLLSKYVFWEKILCMRNYLEECQKPTVYINLVAPTPHQNKLELITNKRLERFP